MISQPYKNKWGKVAQWQKAVLILLIGLTLGLSVGRNSLGFLFKGYFDAKKHYFELNHNLETGKLLLADQTSITAQYEKNATGFYENITSDSMVPEFLKNLSVHYCKLISVAPLKEKNAGIYIEKIYQIQMQGGLPGFLGFLKSMQSSCFKGQIQNLQIRSTGKEEFTYQYQFVCLVSPKGKLKQLFQSGIADTGEPQLKLSGFWVQGETFKTLISGMLVSPGDYLGSYRVSAVDAKAGQVVLVRGGKEIVLRK